MKDNKLKKSAFTLTELLAVILILSIISSICIGVVMYSLNDIDNIIDDTTKEEIFSSAKQYVLEFRNKDSWEESTDTNGNTTFCVSLDTLIDKGYFQNKKNNYDKFREQYAVRFIINKGVYSYEFVNLNDITNDSDICKYGKRKSDLVDSDNNEVNKITNEIKITEVNDENKDDSKEFGNFNYYLSKIDESKYLFNYNLDLNFFDIVDAKNDVYVNLVIDGSGSMVDNGSDKKKTGFVTSMNAMIPFTETLIEKLGDNVNLSLIGFGSYPKLLREYNSSSLTYKDFGLYGIECGLNDDGSGEENKNFYSSKCRNKYYLGWTNTSGGLDMATSLIYNTVENSSKNDNIYTILLYDGDPSRILKMQNTGNNLDYLMKKNSSLSPYDINKKYGNYSISSENELAYLYFKNLLSLNLGTNNLRKTSDSNSLFKSSKIPLSYNDTEIEIRYIQESSSDSKYINSSANYLKELGSKIIFLGYGSNINDSKIQSIASIDNEFCNDSSKKDKNGNYYCYYKVDSGNLADKFSNFAENIIKNTTANGIEIEIKPVINNNGEPLVSFSKDGELVDEIKLEYTEEEIKNNNGKISLKDGYQINLNNAIFDQMYCNLDDKICEFNEGIEIFSIDITLKYLTGDKKLEPIKPKINIALTKTSTLN